MTNMLTDTDLTVIEGLDFEPGCETQQSECDKRAAVFLVGHSLTCPCDLSRYLCDIHLQVVLARRDEYGTWTCVCGQVDVGKWSDVAAIDRIEPLR